MLIVIPDTTRTFPAHAVPYMDAGLDDLYNFMVTVKRANCPLWTDESPSDFGMQLINLFAVIATYIVTQANRAKNNTYIGATQNRESMRALCKLINYELGEGTSAGVTATFTCEGGHPGFTIPAGTQISTPDTNDQDSIVFETGADEVVGAAVTSVDVICNQGITTTEEVLGQSNGTSHQRFTLLQASVIWHSETVEVYDGVWTTWTMVDDFIDSLPTSQHYRTELGTEGVYSIVFGDGVNGAIPPVRTNNIRATYRVGIGALGNVAAGVITEVVSSVTYLEAVTNAAASTGATDRETLEHARHFAPANIRTLQRAVTLEDIETLCTAHVSTTYGGIAQAKAHVVSSYLAHVAVVPATGGLPSSALRTELANMLTSYTMVGTSIQVVDPAYVSVDISASITALASYHLATVAGQVEARLQNFLSSEYQDPDTGLYPHAFGRNIYLSDVYAIIRNTAGVDHCQIIAPTSNTIVEDYQIATPGTITITAYGDETAPAFHDSRLDLKAGGDKYGAQHQA